jgi:dynein heavy chain
MPKEGDLFVAVDRQFRRMMAHCQEDPSVLKACDLPGLLDDIVKANKDLETILKVRWGGGVA